MNKLLVALKDIRDRALDHPVCDLDLYERHDVDGLCEIGGEICDWTMIAIIANDAIKEYEAKTQTKTPAAI